MDGDQFILYECKFASLQKMAAHTVALRIWHGYISRSGYYKNQEFSVVDDLGYSFELSVNFQLECNELVKSLQLPKSIENRLVISLENIHTEIDIWIYGFKDFVFDEELERYMYRVSRTDENYCVWTPNCTIDYVKTASKMLSTAELNKVQKFIVMCKFCLADEIMNFPFHSLHWKTVKLLYNDTVLEYWLCKLKDEPFSMTMETAVLFCTGYNRYAFEYFWKCLNGEQQVRMGAFILISGNGECLLEILSKMSDPHQSQLICLLPDLIIKDFICVMDMPEYATLSWVKTKDLIDEDGFRNLVAALMCMSVVEYKGTRYPKECHDFLLYVWDTAPDRLKNHLVRVCFDYIVTAFFHKLHNHSTSSLKFVYRALALKSPEYRKSFMLDNAVQFATRVPVLESNLTTELVKFCLPNIDDRMKFKRLIMVSEGAFKESYRSLF